MSDVQASSRVCQIAPPHHRAVEKKTMSTESTTPCGCYASLVNRLRGDLNEEAAKAIEHLSELLVEVYSQCGNHRPPAKRHALTPNIRDRIRDWLYA